MTFGDILEQWEKEKKGGARPSGGASSSKPKPAASSPAPKSAKTENSAKISPMDAWLNRYGVQDKDAAPEAVSRSDWLRMQSEERRKLRAMKPEAEIDLHGLSADDAARELDSFFAECRSKGLRKVLIIHGRGIHSEGQPVLSSIVTSFVERCPFAGEYGKAAQKDGGCGAMWVILKKT